MDDELLRQVVREIRNTARNAANHIKARGLESDLAYWLVAFEAIAGFAEGTIGESERVTGGSAASDARRKQATPPEPRGFGT